MGTVNLTEGKYQGDVAVSNLINVKLDKKSNRGVYSIEIQRAALDVKSIEITKQPVKTEYIEGQKIDTTGMIGNINDRISNKTGMYTSFEGIGALN